MPFRKPGPSAWLIGLATMTGSNLSGSLLNRVIWREHRVERCPDLLKA